MPSRVAAAGAAIMLASLRAAQTPVAAAVTGGAQDRNPEGTPRMLRDRPLMLTRPPATASTDRTLCRRLIRVTCAGVAPAGTTTARSATISCRGGDPGTVLTGVRLR